MGYTVRSIHCNLGTLREGSGITDNFSRSSTELSAFDAARQRLRRMCVDELITSLLTIVLIKYIFSYKSQFPFRLSVCIHLMNAGENGTQR